MEEEDRVRQAAAVSEANELKELIDYIRTTFSDAAETNAIPKGNDMEVVYIGKLKTAIERAVAARNGCACEEWVTVTIRDGSKLCSELEEYQVNQSHWADQLKQATSQCTLEGNDDALSILDSTVQAASLVFRGQRNHPVVREAVTFAMKFRHAIALRDMSASLQQAVTDRSRSAIQSLLISAVTRNLINEMDRELIDLANSTLEELEQAENAAAVEASKLSLESITLEDSLCPVLEEISDDDGDGEQATRDTSTSIDSTTESSVVRDGCLHLHLCVWTSIV